MKTSAETKDLFTAIIAVSSKLVNPQKSASNPHFKSGFAPLDEITKDVRPILAANGLAVIQDAKGGNGNITVSTMIIHSSGQWVETDGLTLKLSKDDPQGGCAAVTYARRYALLAALNIVGTDEDDDGNTASTPATEKSTEERVRDALALIAKTTDLETLNKITAKAANTFKGDLLQQVMFAASAKKAEIEMSKGNTI